MYRCPACFVGVRGLLCVPRVLLSGLRLIDRVRTNLVCAAQHKAQHNVLPCVLSQYDSDDATLAAEKLGEGGCVQFASLL